MNVNNISAKFFLSSLDSYDSSNITPLVDCEEFDKNLHDALDMVGTHSDPSLNATDYILIANWWLGLVGGDWEPPQPGGPAEWTPVPQDVKPYLLDPFNSPNSMLDVLIEKASRGVDVKIMGWVSYTFLKHYLPLPRFFNIRLIQSSTTASIQALRQHESIGGDAILNVIAHSAGSVHAKVIIVGSGPLAIGFTGGIDLVADRWATSKHSAGQYWHDVVAKVEGPAVQGLYDWFKMYWDQNLKDNNKPRKPISVKINDTTIPHILTEPDAPSELLNRDFSVLTAGTHRVQSLRTIPARRYVQTLFTPEPPNDQLPQDGIFEIRDAWKQAIEAAQTYIYIEDQTFSSIEVFSWIRKRVQEAPALRVVLLTSGRGDPNDPPDQYSIWTARAINNSLILGLSDQERGRICLFRRWGETLLSMAFKISDPINTGNTTLIQTDIPSPQKLPRDALADGTRFVRVGNKNFIVIANAPASEGDEIILTIDNPTHIAVPQGSALLRMVEGIVVHAKCTLIDDFWALIGSANCMQRSLYTDVEHAVSVIDEKNSFVKNFRKKLWSHHFGPSFQPDDFDDIRVALHAWESSWFSDYHGPQRPNRIGGVVPEYIQPVKLPITPAPQITEEMQLEYDTFLDVDSRQPWTWNAKLKVP